jgi:hypothetical protein
MANNGGKIESLITVPTGGWDMTVNEQIAGSVTVTIADAGDTYYLSTADDEAEGLLATIKTELDADATLNGTYTVTMSATTGVVTISVSGATFQNGGAFTWPDTDFRDLLGFAGGEATGGVTTASGTNASQAVWIPDCPVEGPFGVETAEVGWREYDAASTQSPAGDVVSTVYNSRQATNLTWQTVIAARARTAAESTGNQAYETFYHNCIFGSLGWASPGGPVRWHVDRTSGTSTVYKIPVQQRTSMSRRFPDYSGLYAVEVPRLVKVP